MGGATILDDVETEFEALVTVWIDPDRLTPDGVKALSQKIMSVQLCQADQCHDRGRTFSGTQRSCEQPLRPPKGPWADLIFDPVVVRTLSPGKAS